MFLGSIFVGMRVEPSSGLTVYTVVGTPAFTHRATRSSCCCRLECPPPDPAGDGSSAAGGVTAALSTGEKVEAAVRSEQ